MGFISTLFVMLASISVPNSHYEWDHFVFTQHWPMAVCDKWESQRGGNTCGPYPSNHWTVHGIWPTKTGTRGPNDCDTSRGFNANEISGIERELDEWWSPIQNHGRKTYFWEHEWSKHGTCALPVIQTQEEYFKKAVEWAKAYNMKEILQRSGITPGGDYSLDDIFQSVKASLKAVPMITCYNNNRSQSVLLEIRICLSTSSQLVDCDGYTNCRGQIHYLNS